MIAQLTPEYIRTRPTKAVNRLISHLLLQGRPLTTDWRWLNSILFAQFNLVKRLPQIKQVEKPIFILGTGRSGSTILGSILSLHPQLVFLNEAKALWFAAFKEEDLIGSYSRGQAYYRLGVEAVTSEICRNFHRLYGYCEALTISKRVVDKYVELIFRIPFLQTVFPDAKLIFLTRHGWDTVQSIVSWSQRYGRTIHGENHDWWGVNNRKWHLLVEDVVKHDEALASLYPQISQFTDHQNMAAVEWVATMRAGLNLLKTIPKDVYQIRYEDLTSTPEPTLKALLDFCELPDDPVLVDYARHVLNPAPTKKPVVLNKVIEPIFVETMQALGY